MNLEYNPQKNINNIHFCIKYAKLQIKLVNIYGIPHRYINQMKLNRKYKHFKRLNVFEQKNLFINYLKFCVKHFQRTIEGIKKGEVVNFMTTNVVDFDFYCVDEFLSNFNVKKEIKTNKEW